MKPKLGAAEAGGGLLDRVCGGAATVAGVEVVDPALPKVGRATGVIPPTGPAVLTEAMEGPDVVGPGALVGLKAGPVGCVAVGSNGAGGFASKLKLTP